MDHVGVLLTGKPIPVEETERCEFPMSLILLNLVTLLPAIIVACMASIFMDKIGHNRLLFVMVFAFLVYFFTQATAYKKLQEKYTISTACVTQLIETNEELSKTNEELSKTNEELSKTKEELSKTNEDTKEAFSKMTKARRLVLKVHTDSLAEHGLVKKELDETNEKLKKCTDHNDSLLVIIRGYKVLHSL
jgi:cell division protein FtsB